MSRALNKNAEKLQVPGIRQFANRVLDYPSAVNLTIGQPDFKTPEIVKQAFIKAVQDDQTTYSHNQGVLELREAASNYLKDLYDVHYDAAHILITNGASEAIDTTLRTILNPDDEVILPGPIYAGYIPVIENMGATAVIIDTTANDCKVTPEMIQQKVTKNTKAVLLNYPNNPTGACLSFSETKALADYLSTQDFYTISDEIYSANTFNGKYTSLGAFRNLKDRLILINGLSKSHAMTGFRIGFCMADAHLISQITIVHAYNCICASMPSQQAAIAAVTKAKHAPDEMNAAYIERRDYLTNVLDEMGLTYITPNGAFYLFIDISPFNMASMSFATLALEEYGIVMVPGSTFTAAGEGYVRLSYAYAMDVLIEGMERLKQMVEALKIEA